MTRLSFCLASAAAAMAVASAAPAAAAPAAPRGEPFRVSVPVGDLDLSAEQGRRALVERFRDYAGRTCAPRAYPASYDPASLRACRAAFESAAQSALQGSSGTR